MSKNGDMIARLYGLPECETPEGVRIVRAIAADRHEVLKFVTAHFDAGWAGEAEQALLQPVSKCFIAVENGRILGFACYDAAALGFFGPIGVEAGCRGRGIGRALLLRTLHAMREYGYAYAVIGWVGSAAPFYRDVIGAEFIHGGEPKNSVYSNLINL